MFSFLNKKDRKINRPTTSNLSRRTYSRKPFKPPTEKQLNLCEKLGILISPNMTRDEVSNLISSSLKIEKYKIIYDDIYKKREEEEEKEERETYGDEVFEKYKEWDAICQSPVEKYHIVYKKGNNIYTDVVELDGAEIVGEKKYEVKVSILFPKIHKEKDIGEYVEWEKELYLNTDQILLLEKVMKEIDMYDIKSFNVARKVSELKKNGCMS